MVESDTDAVVLAHAARHGRVRGLELAAELGIGTLLANLLLQKLELRRLIGPADNLGWHLLPINSRADRKSSTSHAHPEMSEQSQKLTNALERVVELEARVTRLVEAGRVVISQRDSWQARALVAESPIFSTRLDQSANRDSRFSELKRLLARELHPDQSQGEGIDRLIREAIFKRIWPMVENIERGT